MGTVRDPNIRPAFHSAIYPQYFLDLAASGKSMKDDGVIHLIRIQSQDAKRNNSQTEKPGQGWLNEHDGKINTQSWRWEEKRRKLTQCESMFNSMVRHNMIKSVGIFPNIVAKTVLIMKIYTRGDLAVLVINIFILQATFYRSIWMEYLLAELYI